MERTRVLVVDQDCNAIRALQELLADEGYEAFATCKAREVRRALAARAPAVLVGDLQMPGLDGLQLRDALAAVEGGPAIIFMSTCPPPRSAQGTPCLLKPIDVGELFAAVAAAVRARGDAGHATPPMQP
jgi:DNA-binding response OmpR family regulator